MASVFGYGSLVNTGTHDYENVRRGQVHGWRRQWVQSNRRDVAFLSARRDPFCSIEGLIADVAKLSWEALDQREAAYNRVLLSEKELKSTADRPVHMYQADPAYVAPEGSGKPILLSYLDCVIQGYLSEFGEEGVRKFFRTTAGWNTMVRNDRRQPIYPRAQTLSNAERDLVDHHLAALSAVVTSSV